MLGFPPFSIAKLMREKKLLRNFILLMLVCIASPVQALDIEVTGAGEHQTPIVIVPFAGEEKLARSISGIVSADLARSGLFILVGPDGKSPHDAQEVISTDWVGADAVAIGKVDALPSGHISVSFHLLDTVRKTELLVQTVSGSGGQVRTLAHRVADFIFEKLTNDPGVFSTRIAYVNRQGKNNQLVVADSDGFDEKIILTTESHIMSPAWSPDGSHIAYVTFEQDHAVVYVQSTLINMRAPVTNLGENSSAPAWSPDGQQLAIAVTGEGNSHIFLVQADGSNLKQITFDDEIDTEPSFSPDGQNLIFTSDREGSVQIFQVSVEGGAIERLTFEGGNSFSPRYSPDGKSFVFSSWINGKFNIATEDLQSKHMQVLTDGGWDENPSFAPNGKLILYAAEVNGHGVLATVSIDAKIKQKISPHSGDILDPMWGPLVTH